jgi:hypothetical protein
MAKLVDLAWGGEVHLGLNSNDVDDQPTPIVKLPQAHEYAQLPPTFVVEHSSKFLTIEVTEHAINYEKIERDVNFQHQQTSPRDNRFLLV